MAKVSILIILSLLFFMVSCLEMSPQAGRLVNQVTLTTPNRPPSVSATTLTRTVYKDRGAQVLSTLITGSDPEGGSVFYKVSQFPSKGVLSECLGLDDTIHFDLDCFYRPHQGVTGEDSFVYAVTDYDLNESLVTVQVTIKSNSTPVAVASTFSVTENGGDQSLGTLTSASDADGDTLSYHLVKFPIKGDLSDCMGLDSTLTTDLECSYWPDDNFQGTDSFIYGASDPFGAMGTAFVTIKVLTTNTGPVASTNPYTVSLIKNKGWQDINLNNSSSFSVTDSNGTPPDYFSYKVITPSSSGSFALCMDQEGASGPYPDLLCSYKPKQDFQGTDVVVFRVSDQEGSYVDVQLNLSVSNSTPSITTTRFSVVEDTTSAINIPVSDGGDGDLKQATGLAPLQFGRFTGVLANGVLSQCLGLNNSTPFDLACTYTPNLDVTSSAADTFKIRVEDLGGAVVEDTITIDVTNVNDAPRMNNQTFTFLQNALKQSFTIQPGWDVDPDETTTLQYTTSTSFINNGYLDKCLGLSGSLNSQDLTCRFTPNTAYVGTTSFSVTVTDVNNSSGSATIYLDVRSSLFP
jgi:hypothetical protein